MTDTDLVVIGGGPVGLVAALHAARAGMSTVVLEPRASPVDKTCGEGLMPAAVRALTEVGVVAPGRPFRGLRYRTATGRAVAEALLPGAPGRGSRRTELHAALTRAAAEAGVQLVPQAMAGLYQQDPARVRVSLTRGRAPITAGAVVGADGLHSPTRRLLGLDRPVRGRRRYGLRRHYAVAPWTDHVEVYWAQHSEAYVTPLAPDLVGVAVLSWRRGGWQEQLAAFPVLQERLAGAGAGPVRGAGPLRQVAAGRRVGQVLLVGDAGGYVDALTGEGLAVGFAQARAAVACLTAGQPGRYPGLARRADRAGALLTRGLVAATGTPAGRGGVLWAVRRLPPTFRGAVRLLAGDNASPPAGGCLGTLH